jgi:hypothetical protein
MATGVAWISAMRGEDMASGSQKKSAYFTGFPSQAGCASVFARAGGSCVRSGWII